jgi:hypothetical protein
MQRRAKPLQEHRVADFVTPNQSSIAEALGSLQYAQLVAHRIDARQDDLQDDVQPIGGAGFGHKGFTAVAHRLPDFNRPAPLEFGDLLWQPGQPGAAGFAHQRGVATDLLRYLHRTALFTSKETANGNA